MKRIILLFIILLLVLSVAQATGNDVLELNNSAQISYAYFHGKLLSVNENLNLLISEDIPSVRYTDLLNQTEQLLLAQKALEDAGGDSDYSLIEQRFKELVDLSDLALVAHDELELLITQVDEQPILLEDETFNSIYEQAKQEYETERFELSLDAIDKAYIRISDIEALKTKLEASYLAASRNITQFISSIKYYLFSFLVVFVVAFVLGRRKYLIYRIKKQIAHQDFRKKVIENLIAKAQKNYFEDNDLSETTFHIRTKKYAELIRDINREKPLLEEKLALLTKHKNS